MTFDWALVPSILLGIGIYEAILLSLRRYRRLTSTKPKIAEPVAVSDPVTLYPTDIVVIEYEGYVTQDVAERIRVHFAEILPGYKVVVFGEGTKMRVVRAFVDQIEIVKRRLSGGISH